MGSAAVFTSSGSASSPFEPIAVTDLTSAERDREIAEGDVNRSFERTIPSPSPSPTPTVKAPPAPVAGLSQVQMHNASIIVEVGQSLGLPKQALIIGVATAMQESNLHNVASEAVPASLGYPHEGTSVDHDSVGLFQQRVSSGWGTVDNLMRPAYQAEKFFAKLVKLDWENMSLTQAAQAVQISAYSNAYAKHESRATTIVNALL